jgi:hypothetical protein
VVAWNDINWSLLWTFVLFTFILWPQMKIYGSGSAYAGLTATQ